MNYGSSGGAHTSDNSTADPDDSEDTDDPAPTRSTRRNVSPPEPQRTAALSEPATERLRDERVVERSPEATAARPAPITVASPRESTAVAVTLAPAAPEPLLSATPSTVLETVLDAAIAPLVLPGPAVPVQTALLWTVLASTRRETDAAAREAFGIPGARNDIYSTPVNTAVTGNILANDEAEGGLITLVSHSLPTRGTVVLDANGDFTYTPDLDYTGIDEFTYTVRDVRGTLTSTSVSFTVLAVNLPPLAGDDEYQVKTGQSLTAIVTFNDRDPEGESFVVIGHTQPAHGSLDIDNIGIFTYRPTPGYVGVDAFDYTIVDPRGATATATVRITVTPVTLIANDDRVVTQRGTPVTIDVRANDLDDSGFPMSLPRLISVPSGSATIDPSGTLTYTPAVGFAGVVTLTYAVSNALGDTALGTVNVTVYNSPPNANGDVYSTRQDNPLVVAAGRGVLSNDVDAEGDALTVVRIEREPLNGSVTIASDGSFVYTPVAGFFGLDEFGYTVADALGDRSSARVLIHVTEVMNLPPIAHDDYVSTTRNTPSDIDVLASDYDPEQNPLQIVDFTQPTSGTVVLNPDGTLRYTPRTDFLGEDSFAYAVTDGVYTAGATVYVTVVMENRPPVARDDAIIVPSGTQVLIDVTGNDFDPDGDEFWVSDYGTPGRGSTGGAAGNRIEYSPDEYTDSIVTDTFTYTITDSAGNTATATVTVTLLPPNRRPVAADDDVRTAVDTPVVIDVLANDTDPDGDPLTIESHGGVAYGTLIRTGTGSFLYVPNQGFFGVDYFDYNIADPDGRISHASVKITVEAPDGEPGAEPEVRSYTVGKNRTLTVSAASGVQAGTRYEGLFTGVESGPRFGQLTLRSDGSFTYTPQPGFVGRDSFGYYHSAGEFGDSGFIATIDVVDGETPPDAPEVGTTLASDSALATCWDNWMPWQRGPGDEALSCLYPLARPEEL